MIIKSLSRKSGIKQVLNYIFKDDKKLKNAENKQLIIRKNVRARSLDKWVKEFEKNEALRTYKRKDSVKMYHTIISFSGKDREYISEITLKTIAQQYMKLQGNNNMYIGTAHYDRRHIHLHIAMSGTKYMTGQANRLSKQEFKELKLAMDKYQRKEFPELIYSLPDHEKKSKEYQNNPQSRNSQKDCLQTALEKAYRSSNCVDGFLEEMRKQGHEPYYRRDKLTGIKYDGERKFRLNRLGYDDKKLRELELKGSIEKQQLEELENIRSQSDSLERESETRDRDIDEEKETEEEVEQDNELDDEPEDDSDME